MHSEREFLSQQINTDMADNDADIDDAKATLSIIVLLADKKNIKVVISVACMPVPGLE